MSKVNTAHHEAAHLMGFIMYIGEDDFDYIDHLSIIEDGDSLGRLKHSKDLNYLFPDSLVRFTLAGPAADFIRSEETDSYAWLDELFESEHDLDGSDMDHVIDKVIFYLEDGANITDFIHPIFLEVVKDIGDHWPKVETIAAKLLEVNEIDQDGLKELCKQLGLIAY